MKGDENKIKAIFDYCHESTSQEIFLRSCGFAQRGVVPPNSEPSFLGDPPSPPSEIGPHRDSNSGNDEGLVESHAARFGENPTTVDSQEDRTVPVDSIPSEKSADLLTSSSSRLEPPAKKLKIPLRDIVEAIVMNSRSKEEREEEEDREIEKKKKTERLRRRRAACRFLSKRDSISLEGC